MSRSITFGLVIFFIFIFLAYSEFVPIEVLIGHSNSRDGTIHASKTECEFKCQLSKSKDLDLCKYSANKTVTTCRCESRYNWNELLNEPAMSAIRCKDVYDSGSSCDKFCQVQANKTTKAASGDLQVFSQKQLETWRYNCRYFFNRSTVSVCACDSDKGQCADFDYGSEYKKYLFQLSTLLLSPFILTIGFILLVILFYYFLAYRLKSEDSVCFSI